MVNNQGENLVMSVDYVQDTVAKKTDIPFEAQQEALEAVERIASPELMVNNQAFHKILTEGVPVEYRKDGVQRGDRAVVGL